MKHQFFFFVLLCFFSAYAMKPENKNNITKSQLTNTLTEFNSYMKHYYPHAFDTHRLGCVIIGIREMNTREFENNKEKLVNMMEDLKTFDVDSLFEQAKLS